ncbi:Flp pilus assembly protein CpaB, partial [Burkholderia sp. DN3021]
AREAARAPSAGPAAGGARPTGQSNTVVIYRGSSIDDGSRGGGTGTPGRPPLPSALAGMPALPGGGNVAAADGTAQPPRAAVPQ